MDIKIFLRFLNKSRSLLRALPNRYCIVRLQYGAARSGGKIEIQGNLHLTQSIIFQGRGKLELGYDVTLGYAIGGAPTLPILLQPRESGALIRIGNGSTLANGVEIIARHRIAIGNNCLIGAKCVLLDSDFHGIKPQERRKKGQSMAVEIGDNVWLGWGVLVLKGVIIGSDSIVAAGCVVTKNIPEGAIAAGNPMKIIGSVYDE